MSASSAALAIDWSGSTGAFTTSSGTNTLSGTTVIADTKNLTIGTTTGGGNSIIWYSPTATTGSLAISCADNAADHAITITNASMGQVTALTIPDPGAATSVFVLEEGTHTMSAAYTFDGTVNSSGATIPAAIPIVVDDTNNTILDLLTFTHSSSDNSAAAGQGLAITFDLENDAGPPGTIEEWARIDVVSTTVTDGSEDGDLAISLMMNGAVTPALLLDSSDQSLTLGQNVTDDDNIDKLRIYGRTTARGSLILQAVANTGNDDTTIKNAAQGGAYTYTVPDAGASANFIMSVSQQIDAAIVNDATSKATTAELMVLHWNDNDTNTTHDDDIVVDHKVKVIDVWLIKTDALSADAADTFQLKNGANAITDAMGLNVADEVIVRASTIDDGQSTINASSTMRFSFTKNSTDVRCEVYVRCLRVA